MYDKSYLAGGIPKLLLPPRLTLITMAMLFFTCKADGLLMVIVQIIYYPASQNHLISSWNVHTSPFRLLLAIFIPIGKNYI